jgi:hypothetical protein
VEIDRHLKQKASIKFSLPYVVNTESLRGEREREGRKERKRKRENK